MDRKLRVLHVEDSVQDVALLTRHLSRAGYEMVSERVDTPAAMRAALETQEWDVILCDYSMPHFDALSALKLLKGTGLEIPFVIISGTIGEELAVEAMRAGANDYLMKDKLARLAPAIERELHEAENRRARRRAEEALKGSEAELRALFGAMSDVILVLDAEGHHLKMAPTKSDSIYRPAAERIGKTLHEVFPKETADQFLHYVRRALDEGRNQRLEYSLSINGREGWFEGSVSPMTSDSVIWVARDITERKDAEQQLLLQSTALQSAANAIVITDKQGTISWVNLAFTNLTGYTLEDVAGRRTSILKSGLHDAAFYQTLWDTILSGQVWHGETTNRRKDGSLYNEEQTITPVLNESGEVTNFIAIKQDITDRTRAEEEKTQLISQIENHRQRLNNIVASVPGVVWEAWGEPDAANQRIDFISDHVETMLGYTVEEWLSTPNFWLSIVHPDDRERSAAEASANFAGGKNTYTQEFRWLAKDGHALWVQASCAVITDDLGRPMGLRGVTTDINERKVAEKKLRQSEQEIRESEERYRDLVEDALDIIYTHDLEGRYTSVNKAGERITGYTKEESLKMNLAQTVAPEYLDKARQMLARKLAGEKITAYDLEIIAKTGQRIAIELNTRIIFENGVPVGVHGIARDVTESKALAEQLRQSQKLEAIGMLAGGIAHDFNNLLTVIGGYSDLTLKRLRDEDPLQRNIIEVKKAADRAAALTRQLLAFSRKQVLQPKVIDLNGVVSELEKLLRRLIGEDIVLRTVLESDLGSVRADPGQIEQIIMNLAVNARDAMPEGGQLTIETKNVYLDEEYSRNHIAVTSGPFVMLAVSDSGVGMDQKTLARIFEPFFTTKEAGKGTGLGLSTVYGIVKQSGGNIWVYSEVGRGTTFKVYLPRIGEGAQEVERNVEATGAMQGSETVLLAEDEEGVRTLARQVLEINGYQVLEAANGGAALLVCERHKETIDLLITDVIMPEMSGRELADRLAQLRPDMKVLFMSGYTDNAIVHQGVLDEGSNFIQKPFATDDLARKVREVLDAPDKSASGT